MSRILYSNKQLLNVFTKLYISTNFSTLIKEEIVNVTGQNINYIRSGTGNKVILCLPGALGTIWSDFKPQIEGIDKNKFTVIAWDPPGHGKSRPPNRMYTKDFYEKDADIAFKFMKAIGINKYSLLGWSDGGNTGMIMAAKYPENISALIMWGSNSYFVSSEVEQIQKMRDLSKWSDRMKAPLIEIYGEQLLQKMWYEWCDIISDLFKEGGNICKQHLPAITCPTLIVHGDKDVMIAAEHPNFLKSNIKNSTIHHFSEGKHNLHLKYAKEFNSIVMDFLKNV